MIERGSTQLAEFTNKCSYSHQFTWELCYGSRVEFWIENTDTVLQKIGARSLQLAYNSGELRSVVDLYSTYIDFHQDFDTSLDSDVVSKLSGIELWFGEHSNPDTIVSNLNCQTSN